MTKDKTQELKACPFCGEADLYHDVVNIGDCAVHCNNCGARGAACNNLNDAEIEYIEEHNLLDGQLSAIKAWNTRHNEAPTGEISAPYGYCPKCGAIGIKRERRINGNDVCKNDCSYPSAAALSAPTGEIKNENAFERFPSLAASILLLAHKANGLTMMEWTIHCQEINKVCELVTRTPQPTGEIGELIERIDNMILSELNYDEDVKTKKDCKAQLQQLQNGIYKWQDRYEANDKEWMKEIEKYKSQLQQAQKMRELMQCLIDENPNSDAADSVTVLEVWRHDAKKVLGLK